MNRNSPPASLGVFGITLVLFFLLVGLLHFQRRQTGDPPDSVTAADLITFHEAGTNQIVETIAVTNVDGLTEGEMQTWPFVRLHVQNKAGQSISSASVEVTFEQMIDGLLRKRKYVVETDAQGQATVRYPANFPQWSPLNLCVSAAAVGLGGKSVRWDAAANVPESFTVTLGRVVSFSGYVENEAGEAIADATVSVSLTVDGISQHKWSTGEYLNLPYQKVTPDAAGYWCLQGIPEGLVDRVGVSADHPDYLSQGVFTESNPEKLTALRARTVRFVLRRGSPLRILVVDEFGSPVPDAEISVGDRWNTGKTGSDGRVKFGGQFKGSIQLEVEATGFEPVWQSVDISAPDEEIVVRMKPGRPLAGIVQNEAGEPIVGVRIQAYSNRRPNFFKTTDETGRFVWNNAPDFLPPFYFSHTGHLDLKGVSLSFDSENIITMKSRPRISGWVVNAETGAAVTNFQIRSTLAAANPPRWSVRRDYIDSHGRFSFEFEGEGLHPLQVEADQYETQSVTPPQSTLTEDLVVRLKPSDAPVLRGLVVSSGGMPQADAQVIACYRRSSTAVSFSGGRLFRRDGEIAKTDSLGRFVLLNPPAVSASLMAVSPKGFGQATVGEVEAGQPIVLHPYGRVQGRLFIDGRPAPRKWIEFKTRIPGLALSNSRFAYMERTDEDGDFNIEMIPPGPGILLDAENANNGEDGLAVNVLTGQITKVDVRW